VLEPEDQAADPVDIEPADPQAALFAEAAAAVQAGRPVATVLAQYPQYHAELELLLGTVAAVELARQRAGGTGHSAGWSPAGSSAPPARDGGAAGVVVAPLRPPARQATPRSGWRGAPLRWAAGLVVLGGLGWVAQPLLLPAAPASHLLSYNDPIEAIAGNHWRIGGNDVLIDAQTQISGTPAVGALARGVGEEITGGSRARLIRVAAPPTLTVPVAQASATLHPVRAVSLSPTAAPTRATPAPPTTMPPSATAVEPTATISEPTATTVEPTATDSAAVVPTRQPATAVTVHRPTGTATSRGASVSGKPLPTRSPTSRPQRSPAPTVAPPTRPPAAQPSATFSPDPVGGRVTEPPALSTATPQPEPPLPATITAAPEPTEAFASPTP